jgi:hypothetical protein
MIHILPQKAFGGCRVQDPFPRATFWGAPQKVAKTGWFNLVASGDTF